MYRASSPCFSSQALDKVCYADLGVPVPCATDGGAGGFTYPTDAAAMEGPFKGLCVNGSR